MASLEAFASGAAGHGLEIELINGNVLRDRYPWLGPGVIGASFCASDGQANPRLVAPSFAVAARRAGAGIHEHEAVVGATRGAGGFNLETETGRQVTARQVVNVAGAWGATVAGWFGEQAPLDPQSPNMQVTEPLAYRLKVNIGVAGGDVYARQTPRGNLIFGGGRGWNDFDRLSSRAGEQSTIGAMARLLEILPWARDAHVIRTWSGIEGFMPDGIPVIGPSATIPGLIHAFGFCGHGFQLGPAIGEVLADLALSGVSSVPIGDFSIQRFVQGTLADRPGGAMNAGDGAAENTELRQGGTR
jgi:sarcosine oxidase subunit beta